ncbi:hypothetical protein ETU08_07510, partial [Apibacter muscae]|uniref:hypothetical protein n=1 Tax=Apibacter muscae TaxID=2509004 RepID=UPI0011ADA355
MVKINTIPNNDSHFELEIGGISQYLPRNYKVNLAGESIIIKNLDSFNYLTNFINYSDLIINGTIPSSAQEAQQLVTKVIFGSNRSTVNEETSINSNYTQSNQAPTGTPFPSNPKVGDYFSFVDAEGNIEEVYQFDGDIWKLFIRHKLNFEIAFNNESFMYYNDIGKLQNFVGYDNYSISKFNIDENNLT